MREGVSVWVRGEVRVVVREGVRVRIRRANRE